MNHLSSVQKYKETCGGVICKKNKFLIINFFRNFQRGQNSNFQKNFVIVSGVAIMLSITIFATIVGEMLPVSDATPLIG
jgi:hypothetical protein